MNLLKLNTGKKRLKSFFTTLLVIAFIATLSACGKSDDDDDNNNTEDTGEVVIGLTDAPGDFVSYTVDVVSLSLTKANGAVVETVPLTTRVDFAQYTEMTEFLTAATIPAGTYVSATLTLDYSNADIQVEDDNGNAIAVQAILDEDNMPVTTMDLSVRLEGRNALFIAPGIPAHLTLDFDLNATNTVDLNNGPSVTVQPVLLAEVNVESPKIHRARGPLKSVDTADSSFRLIIRPFIHILSGGNEDFGTLKVTTTNDTVFDISGDAYQGSDGLTQLSMQTTLTAVVVIGDLKFNPTRFEATEVRAGSSVAGGDMDAVTGNVISRSGDVVTLKGATLIRSSGSVIFNDEVQVTLGGETVVRRQLSIDALTMDDISVGQRVTIFGSSADDHTMDATSGYAYMLLTTLRASVVDTATPLTIDVQSIDGRRIALFDFTGTGATEDADPLNYEIDTGTLNTGGISIGDVLKVRGFVKPWANPETADFTAQTIVNVSSIPGFMAVGWPLGSATAISIDSNAQKVTLDLSNTGLFHHISRAGVAIDLTQLGMDTTLQPKQDLGLYFVLQDGVWQLHTSFSIYLTDLQSRLDANGSVRSVTATGTFNDNTAEMTVGAMTVHILSQ